MYVAYVLCCIYLFRASPHECYTIVYNSSRNERTSDLVHAPSRCRPPYFGVLHLDLHQCSPVQRELPHPGSRFAYSYALFGL